MKPHVLVIRLDNDGDVLLTGPAVRAIAAGARFVSFLCGPRGRGAAELLPCVDAILEYRAPWIDPDPEPVDTGAVSRLVDQLRQCAIDEAVIFTSFHQSPLPTALVLRLAGVARIAAISDDYPGALLDVRHHVLHDVHEVERSLSLAEAAGYPLPEGDDATLAVRPLPRCVPVDRYVVVHPGASMTARAGDPDLLRDVVSLLAEGGRRVLVTGSSRERRLTARVAGEHGSDLGGRTTLADLAIVLAGASAVVVGNTGPAHLAAAVGTPVVSLYAPTVPASRWRPWGVPHVLLGDQSIACAGCRARECPVPGHPCLSGVTAETVVAAVESLAQRTSPRPDLERRTTLLTGGRP
ncbi:MAG TPA: glycosyltransferase family 9 protein [Gaiella sp.]|nr:glycosyltransferase family 9 protein [Gaiella sp.]